MIEVFDSETRHLVRCKDRERLAALAAHNLEATRKRLARMSGREAPRKDG